MADSRIGFLTPEQEVIADKLYKAKGLMEKLDGKIIQLGDNKIGQALKKKIINKHGEDKLEAIYDIVDLIFEGLEELV